MNDAASLSPPEADRFPLSFAQQRLWLLDQLHPGQSAYAMPAGLLLDGPLDRAALAAALADVVARHEVLRSRFILADDQAWQEIDPPGAAALAMEEIGAYPPDAAHALARQALQDLSAQPFDLARGPVLRARLLAFGPATHALLLVLHHIVADGWSMGILTAELAAAYAARRNGVAPDFEPLSIQYADYAAWQRETLTGARRDALAQSWRDALAGAPALLELPTDRPRPRTQRLRGALVAVHVPAAALAPLAGLEKSTGATRAMSLLAAFGALLARLSGQDDVVIGMPAAGRLRPELEPLIGCFLNMLPLRLRIAATASFRDLLAQARAASVQAQAHQEFPFEQIVQAVDAPRELGASPVFQAMLAFHNQPRVEPDFAGLRATPLAADGSTAKFDLTLSVGMQESGALDGTLEYDADLFDAASAERMARCFAHLLQHACMRPDTPLQHLPLMPAQDLAQVLDQGRGPRRDWPSLTFVQGFAEQAARTPDAIAARFPDNKGAPCLTYRQLHRRAQRLARQLAARGARPGTRIAVFLDRGPLLLTALLAVQQAGAAYVPLDPLFPPVRLQHMLEDAAPLLILTEPALASCLPRAGSAQLLLHEPDNADDGAQADPGPALESVLPDHPAYVLYTSGSTGRPKGVQVSHRALHNLLCAMMEEPGFGPGDAMLALTTVSFDISGLELYLPLLAGGQVIMAGRASAQDPERLKALLEAEQPTVMQATPATWRMLVAAGWHGMADPATRATPIKALCGGEALPGELAATLAPRVRELWNVYGPTETTIWSTCCRVGPEHHGAAAVPIGRAIANTFLYVLDPAGQLVAPGVAGELAIGGEGVADGYLNRPQLTAERFPRDAFLGIGRLYRTGDQVRWRGPSCDGLEYLGRMDLQVKIRGYRIELGEVEGTLAAHPGVAQAVVVPVAGPDGAVLAAYLVRAPGHAEEPEAALLSALRTRLKEALPDYMLPAHWKVLPRLPLTPNGKVDRKALPAPAALAAPQAAGEPPQGAAEQLVAGVWQDVLQTASIGRDDDFFQRGGHSLAAVTALMALRKRGWHALQLADVFGHPTPARLARRWAVLQAEAAQDKAERGTPAAHRPVVRLAGVERPQAAARRACLPINLVLMPGAGGDPTYLAPLAQALAAQEAAEPMAGAALDGIYGVFAPGLEGGAPAPSLQALALSYRAALQAALPPGPVALVGHSLGSHAAVALAQCWQDAERPLLGAVMLDTVAPVLAEPPFDTLPDGADLEREIAAAIAHWTQDAPDAGEAQAWAAKAPAMAAVYRAGLAYRFRAQAPLAIPIALLKAIEQVDAPTRRPSAELLACLATPDWGWRELTRVAFDAGSIDGDHLTLAATRHAATLARRIGAAIAVWIAAGRATANGRTTHSASRLFASCVSEHPSLPRTRLP
jgi:amino acid adenylation domain-containing protein